MRRVKPNVDESRQVAEQLENLIEGHQWEWARRLYAGLTDAAQVEVKRHLQDLIGKKLMDQALELKP